ncbi:MAG TPA: hypothetical protein VMX97_06885, partial [Hyphomicrobiaceae bacterium]|nr:hypothetical protein [Hyphomicrobiaceae bacterium]
MASFSGLQDFRPLLCSLNINCPLFNCHSRMGDACQLADEQWHIGKLKNRREGPPVDVCWVAFMSHPIGCDM